MKTLTPALLAHIKQGVTTLTTCLEIVRRDGKSFHFTDHDQPLTVSSARYTPVASFMRSSVSTTLQLEVDSMEVKGILNDAFISRDDVAAGLFDYAAVRFFAVNYEAPDSGTVTLRTGWLGEVTTSEDGTFSAELRGLTQALAYRIGESYSPECRAQLGDKRCRVALAPSRWLPNQSYAKGDVIVGVVNPATSYFGLSFNNPGFDNDSEVELTRDITGWTSYGDSRGRWTIRQDDFHGGLGHDSYSAYGTDDGSIVFDIHGNPTHTVANIGMYQDVDLEGQGLSHYSIDTGLCRIYSTIWMICVNGKHGGARYRIVALDEDKVQVGSAAIYDTGVVKSKEDVWFQYTAKDVLIPAGTRYLRFYLDAQKKATDEEGAGFDTITCSINDPDGTFGSNLQYGGVAFQAQNAGTTSGTEPTWSATLGSTYTDGTVTWKCIKAFNSTTTVGGVAGGGSTITPVGITDAAGYYDGGFLKWETGKNSGRAQEVKTWNGSALALFERPFHLPEIGDRFALYPGCDLLRATCVTKFSNILNFRGEPDVPGQDKYYSTPNAASN